MEPFATARAARAGGDEQGQQMVFRRVIAHGIGRARPIGAQIVARTTG
jgi:hypothetical protein